MIMIFLEEFLPPRGENLELEKGKWKEEDR